MPRKSKTHVPFPLTELTTITPLDGRYYPRTQDLAAFVSEYALIKTRFEIEAKYLLALAEVGIIRKLTSSEKKRLQTIAERISLEIAQEVKTVEKETRHDVKAMERVFRKLVKDTSLEDIVEVIHFGLTSEDINNIAYRLVLFRATHQIVIPELENVLEILAAQAEKHKAIPMLARTHGQAAVPTTVGKELVIFAYRLKKQLASLKKQQLTGKLTGAVGNFNALHFVYPAIDWVTFSEKFIISLGFTPNLYTTQINLYDDVIEFLQIYQRINNILIGFDQDMWRYISDNWFVQEVKKGEVGSSTMPQKVNPIDFENSEGNLGMANTLIEFLTRKLPVSRLQRDLSDSTVIRNIGTILGYSLIGYQSTVTGFSRVRANVEQIQEDLQKDWAILTEGVQTYLRKQAIPDSYSLIAGLSRGERIVKDVWHMWIANLPISAKDKKFLEKLKPETYIGLAEMLTEKALQEIHE